MTKLPTPGDFGLSRIGGFTGKWINLGQAITGDSSRYTHAFIVLDDNTIMEAQPKGAEIAPLDKYLGKAVFSNIPLTNEQRYNIVQIARDLEGIPYSFIDYLALSVKHLHIPAPHLNKYISNSGHMICSQLVDYTYCKAGIHLFKDGRLSQDVTPGDLANLLIEKDWIDV